MRLASVILDIPTQSLDRPYFYLIPPQFDSLSVGCAVVVPFGSRKALGYVVEILDSKHVNDSAFDPSKLKELSEVVSDSFFDEQAAACARYLSDTYIAPLSSCIRLFTPPGGTPKIVRNQGSWVVKEPVVKPVDDRWVRLLPEGKSYQPPANAHKQIRMIEALKAGELRVSELALEFGSPTATLKALEKKGVISIELRRKVRGELETDASMSSERAARQAQKIQNLTEEQIEALRVIRKAQQNANGSVVVVDGVTGSGKTEIYLRAIDEVLSQNKGAIVLVPEISLTPQTVARFRGRFGDKVAVLHSRLGVGERFDQWERIRSKEAKVVVGARSALFAPVQSLGLIVIDEEHEGSYKQDTAPRYNARDVAAWIAAQKGAALVLGSATPSIEALDRCNKNPLWKYVVLKNRVNGKPLPRIEVVDMASEFGGGHRSMFSRELRDSLLACIKAGHKAVLMLNQRGFAQFLLCRDCGHVPSCDSCATSLTYHEQGNSLVCHHCGHTEPSPSVCPVCGSPFLKKFGAGTQRVESELLKLVEGFDTRVIRMDSDTTRKKGAHEALLDSFAQPGSAILLGTQMIAKGLDFEEVTVVGVINADTTLNLPDFRSAERTFNLLEQVAGRAGRAELSGKVLVQTYQPESAAIKYAARYDRASFLQEELLKREQLLYPPYVQLVNILIWGEGEQEVCDVARALSADIARLNDEVANGKWNVLPATQCPLWKVRKSYRQHIVIRSSHGVPLAKHLLSFFRTRKTHQRVHVAVDVDPANLL